MIGLSVILIGLIVAYTGFTGRGTAMIETLKTPAAGYPNISFIKYSMGLTVASLPIIALKDDRRVNAYMVLILLSILIFNYNSLTKFAGFIRGLR